MAYLFIKQPESALAEGSATTSSYYSNQRDDILRLIPEGTRTLLDVGCGEGTTGARAKKMYEIQHVVGVEAVVQAANVAAGTLDEVLAGDIETMDLNFPDGYFDCMVFADVLEHLRAPEAVLKRLLRYLNDNGVVIASIPNLRNVDSLLKIITDRFEYEDSGILDRTHLRFFTLHTMKVMFREAGYTIVSIRPEFFRGWRSRLLRAATLGLMSPFLVYRYTFVAVKDGQASPLGGRSAEL